MLQVLYKLKTAKVFDRSRSKEDKGSAEASDEDPFAIQQMAWCAESRMLCVAGVSANIIVYRFSKLEVTTEVVQVRGAGVGLFLLFQKLSAGNSSHHTQALLWSGLFSSLIGQMKDHVKSTVQNG